MQESNLLNLLGGIISRSFVDFLIFRKKSYEKMLAVYLVVLAKLINIFSYWSRLMAEYQVGPLGVEPR
jgi:hypothetical protein